MPSMTSRTPGFLLLSANTPWVYALGESLAAHGPVTAMRFYDWSNQRRLKPEWPETVSAVRRVPVAMPPGYAGTLEPLFRPLMRFLVERERSRLRHLTGVDPIVICPYPYLEPWVRQIPARDRVYYNLDDYVFYDPPRAARIRALEGAMIVNSRLTLCLSAHEVRRLSGAHPSHADRIRHFPLGVTGAFLNPSPETAPLPKSVGYVGSMTGRVDWPFVVAVAKRLPDVTFYFVGRVDREGGDEAWRKARAAALALDNLVAVGEVPQAHVCEHYWRYAMNWMPYDAAHAFNIASCPTKIMDALASGRPFLSTDIPEPRLYPDRIRIARDADDAATAIRTAMAATDHDARGQVAFAARNTWSERAKHFLELAADHALGAAMAPAPSRLQKAVVVPRQDPL
jgi:teichuronic acid biosynthesis glycosyltransferase TuaH